MKSVVLLRRGGATRRSGGLEIPLTQESYLAVQLMPLLTGTTVQWHLPSKRVVCNVFFLQCLFIISVVSCFNSRSDTAHQDKFLSPPDTTAHPQKNLAGAELLWSFTSFNIQEIPRQMSGWSSGVLELPPGYNTAPTDVGTCCYIFHMYSCDEGSVECNLVSAGGG